MTNDQLDRVALMAGDTQGAKWDLSPNDRAALAAVVAEVRRLQPVAGVLRDVCLRFDEEGNDGGESLGQELREQIDDVLAAAGVDAPKMATWRMSEEAASEPVMVVARGKAGVVR